MHEMSIAGNILELIDHEMAQHPAARLLAFDVEVGELSCCQDESLRFCLEAALGESEWQGVEVRITAEPVGAVCGECSTAFAPKEYEFVCPACGATNVQVTGGREVQLTSLEIEE